MVSRFMILSSLSLISTYVFYRALELEQLNKMKPQLKPDQIISQIVNDQIEEIMMSRNNNNNLYYKQYKFILWLNYKEKDGMSKFSECEYSNCILTPNEEFISRGSIDLFDAVVISVEAYKEDHKGSDDFCITRI